MEQLKRDRVTGEALIVEPNAGRPTGRSAIAERGGVELLLFGLSRCARRNLADAVVQTYQGVKVNSHRRNDLAALVAMSNGRLTPLGWWRSCPRAQVGGRLGLHGTPTIRRGPGPHRGGRVRRRPGPARPWLSVASPVPAASPRPSAPRRRCAAPWTSSRGGIRGRRDQLAVLTYHRVDEPGTHLYPGLVSATPEAFDRQVSWLAEVVPPGLAGRGPGSADGGPALPRRAVLITFDDGYLVLRDHAWPILQRHGVPAALFVPTAYPDTIDRTFWWNRLHRAMAATTVRGPLDTPVGRLDLATADERGRSFKALRAAIKDLPHDRATTAVDEVIAALGGAPGRPSTAGATVLGWDELRALRATGAENRRPTPGPIPSWTGFPRRTWTARSVARGTTWSVDWRVVPSRPSPIPTGNHSPAVLAAVGEPALRAGIHHAPRHLNDLRRPDWLTRRRINVSRSANRAALTAQLHGWLDRWT